jgi:hypothetical protein
MGAHDKDREVRDEGAEEDIVHMRGPNGYVWAMALPLPEAMAYQVAKGELVQVNEDGSPWEPSEDDPELIPENDLDRLEREHLAALEYAELKRARPDEDPIVLRDEAADTVGDVIPEDAPQAGDEPKPKVSASKAVWVGYAKSHGMSHEDADAMTKAELVEKFS